MTASSLSVPLQVFSTSMSHHTILSVHCSLDALCDAQQPRRKAQLHTNTRRLIGGLSSILHSSSTPAPAWLPAELQAPQLSGLAPSPIVPLLTPYARELAERLRSKGFLVRSICYPTVPRGQERVRICVHAENREEDVDGLVRAVQTWSSEVLQQQQPQLPQKRPANLRKEIDAARL
jgi:8-amino-7-oxononanoate synthase